MKRDSLTVALDRALPMLRVQRAAAQMEEAQTELRQAAIAHGYRTDPPRITRKRLHVAAERYADALRENCDAIGMRHSPSEGMT